MQRGGDVLVAVPKPFPMAMRTSPPRILSKRGLYPDAPKGRMRSGLDRHGWLESGMVLAVDPSRYAQSLARLARRASAPLLRGVLVGCVAWFVGGFQSLGAEDRGVRESGTAVGALGRLEPSGGVVQVAAPYSVQGPSILAELLVGEGQSVTNNQALARTHVHESAQAAW